MLIYASLYSMFDCKYQRQAAFFVKMLEELYINQSGTSHSDSDHISNIQFRLANCFDRNNKHVLELLLHVIK